MGDNLTKITDFRNLCDVSRKNQGTEVRITDLVKLQKDLYDMALQSKDINEITDIVTAKMLEVNDPQSENIVTITTPEMQRIKKLLESFGFMLLVSLGNMGLRKKEITGALFDIEAQDEEDDN
jgi:hypothetical protein